MPFFRSTLFACKHIYSIFDVSFKCYSSTTRSLLCVCIWAVQSIEAWNFYFEYVLTDNNVVQKQHANIQCHQHCIWKACLCPFEFIKCQILMRTVQCSVLFAYLYYFFSHFAFHCLCNVHFLLILMHPVCRLANDLSIVLLWLSFGILRKKNLAHCPKGWLIFIWTFRK